MDELINQINFANQNGLYMLSLYSALTLPDIGGAVDSEDGKSTGEKYKRWYNKYVEPNVFHLSGAECWEFRCRVLHQGKSIPDKATYYTKIGFIEPNSGHGSLQVGRMESNGKPGMKIIDLKILVEEIIKGWKRWVVEKRGTQPFEENYLKCIVRYPFGYQNLNVGAPFIC